MKFIVQDTFSIKKVLIFGGFGLCRFQHKVGMNSFPMRMNVISYGTNSFPWGMYSFRSKIPIVHVVFVYIKACRLVFTLQRTATAKTSVNSLLILSIYSQSSSECVSLMNESLFKELRLASLILTLDFVRSGERRKIFVLVILLQ